MLAEPCSARLRSPRSDGVVMFSGLATNPDIADAGDYIFRTSLSDAQRGVDTGNVLWADGVRTLATITEATDYAEGVRRTTVAQFEQRGGEVVAVERYASDATDFRTSLTKLLERESGRAAHRGAVGVHGRHRRQAGCVNWAMRDRSTRRSCRRHDGAGDRRRCGDRPEGGDHRYRPGQREGPGGARQLPREVRLRHAALVPGLGLRRPSTSQPHVLRRRTTTRTRTVSATASMRSPGAARSATTTASTSAARWSVWTNVVVEVLPVSERNDDNNGYKVLGPAPSK